MAQRTPRKIVAGNWKMHGSSAMLSAYVEALGSLELADNVSLVLFPPVAFLDCCRRLLAGQPLEGRLELGAQDLHPEREGAFTGEISGPMIRDLGGSWVLVGHSERRQYQGESDELVARKAEAALTAGLKPVVCVGETEAERDAGAAEEVVSRQVAAVTARLDDRALAGIVVAYEPVWAIGTGRTASAEQAQATHAVIREQLRRACDAEIPLLYGGSVKSGNAAGLFAQPDIDGALVGGASLDAQEFAAIVAAADVDTTR